MSTHLIPIVGIAGQARSGKDTVSQIIRARDGRRYRYAFADPLKEMADVVLRKFGPSVHAVDFDEAKDRALPWLNVSPRRILQLLGTEWGRNLIHPDLWLMIAERTFHANGPGMVISDVRFGNEADWVRSIGGVVVHVSRPGIAPVESHESEQALPIDENGKDIAIVNDGTLDDLKGLVARLMQRELI